MPEPIIKKIKEEVLKTPIKDLGLQVVGSLLESPIKKLYEELGAVGIQFRPSAYLTDDWGCPDGVPVIGLPFYLADEVLARIEKEKMGLGDKIMTSADQAEIQQILRHEAGHAFNYAYSLFKLPRWQELFGVYEKAYDDNFAPTAGSNKFVKHLEGWYAQKHPDEDFAETFAVLITPEFDWRKEYKNTPAYEKLDYVSALIKEYKDKPVPAFANDLDAPVESITLTVDDWYKKRLAEAVPQKKILILFYQEYPRGRVKHDEVVDQIKEILLESGYLVVLLPINRSIERITSGVAQEKPDLIFNLCETFRDDDKFEFNVTALLEMMHVPFTGSSSGSLFLSGDKVISKKIFSFHNIPYPKFFVVPKNVDLEMPKNFAFPLFVKPAHEDTSIGIDDNSFVTDEDSLRKKVKEIHEKINDDAVVEEYIDGREFFVTVLGHNSPKALPVVELEFVRWPKQKPKIYTYKAKVDPNSDEFKSTTAIIPENLAPELKNKIQEVALKVFRALGAKDYARVDIRMDKDNNLYVLESNLNPYLAKSAETAFAAKAAGTAYRELIGNIVELTLARASMNK